jgi:hypothetical protein
MERKTCQFECVSAPQTDELFESRRLPSSLTLTWYALGYREIHPATNRPVCRSMDEETWRGRTSNSTRLIITVKLELNVLMNDAHTSLMTSRTSFTWVRFSSLRSSQQLRSLPI